MARDSKPGRAILRNLRVPQGFLGWQFHPIHLEFTFQSQPTHSIYLLWLNQNGHEFGRYLNFRYTPGVPGFRISSPSSRVDAKNAFDGYIHSMRSATEGSGDNKGLSEKMDSEEKEPWLKTDCPVIEGAVTGIPSASSFTCCKRGKHTPLFINQWEKDIYVFFCWGKFTAFIQFA